MSTDFAPHSATAVRDAFTQAFEGVRVLRDAKLMQPCLVVLYSAIDAAAWMAAEHDGDVTKSDFLSWVDRFLLPESKLDCTAFDLYGARCGVLHSFSAYSSLQRQGKARLVCYVWGAATVADLQERLKHLPPDSAVAVHIDDLANALIRGWERCLLSLESKPDAVQRLAHRASHLFSSVRPDPVTGALANVREMKG